MTKYEWERELEKNLHTLPKDEVKRVLEYYNELFIDKIERGGTETSVIAEFGNPFDVANKIIAETVDLDASDDAKPTAETVTAAKKEEGRKKEDKAEPARASDKRDDGEGVKPADDGANKKSGSLLRVAVFVVLCIFLGGTFVGVVSGLFAAAAGLTVGSVGMMVGGVIAAIGSLVHGAGVSVWAAVAQAGVCIMIVGAGIVLFPLCIRLIRFMVKLLVKICTKIARFLTGKSEAQNEN